MSRINKNFSVFIFIYSTCISIYGNEYDSIFNLTQKYTRPITLLELSDNGSPSVNLLMKMYPDSVFVLLSPQNSSSFLKSSNFIHLKHNYSINDLIRLGESEHFDIVICYADSCFKNKNEYIKALYNLGENIFVFTKKSCGLESYLINHNFNKISSFKNLTLYFNAHKITFLKRNQWLEPPSNRNCVRQIISAFDKKILHKNYGKNPVSSTWLPGINLITFKMLNGQIPTSNILTKEIIRLSAIPHLDWMPNNMIVQGSRLSLIDFQDTESISPKTVRTLEMINLVTKLVQEPTCQNIPRIFQEILFYCRQQLHPLKKYKSSFEERTENVLTAAN